MKGNGEPGARSSEREWGAGVRACGPARPTERHSRRGRGWGGVRILRPGWAPLSCGDGTPALRGDDPGSNVRYKQVEIHSWKPNTHETVGKIADMLKPMVAVVTGRAGSGKTTLAPLVASALGWPLVTRDGIKEAMLESLGLEMAADRGLALRATEAFFEEVSRLAGLGDVVAEAAFQHSVWASRLSQVMAGAEVRVVLCEVPAEVARSRWEERARRDAVFAAMHPDLPVEVYEPPELGVPTLRVSTLDGYEPGLAEIVAFLR